jgi:hypothetical protein
VHSAYIWDYPNQKNLLLDREYVKTLHHVLGGKAGNRFYVVAPIIAMGFMEDEVIIGDTAYSFLKVPLSVLMALIEKGEPGSLKQPTSENDVNEVIDAMGEYYQSANAIAKVVNKRSQALGFKCKVLPSTGSAENVDEVLAGDFADGVAPAGFLVGAEDRGGFLVHLVGVDAEDLAGGTPREAFEKQVSHCSFSRRYYYDHRC